MNKLYMGLDIGVFSVKGVIIDEYDNIIASSCLNNNGNSVDISKKVIKELLKEIDLNKYQVVAIGTTGLGRKLIGKMIDACIIKNEIMAEAVGTLKVCPDVRTIFDIGGEDEKIILLKDGVVYDYAINTSCSAEGGLFISSLAERLNIKLEDITNVVSRSKNKISIASRCRVFAETEINRKIQQGYQKEDILAGASRMVAFNYFNNVLMGKKIVGPIVFNGGVSKNIVVVQELEELVHGKIIVSKNSCFMASLGVAIMARESNIVKKIDFSDIDNINIETKIKECGGCSNNCEIVTVYKNKKLIDTWGNKCADSEFAKNI